MIDTLYFHHYNDYSGSTKVLADYLDSKYADKNEVVVLTDNTTDGFLSDIGIRIINVPILRIKGKAIPFFSQLLWIIVGLYKAVKYGRKYEVFYINTIIPMYAAVSGTILNKKIIYHIHEKYITKSIKSVLAEFVFNHVKAERRFVSNYVAGKYKEKEGCQEIIQYNKLSKSFQSKVKIIKCENHTRDHIIMISSLQKGKGVDNFVSLASMMPDLKFTLILNTSKERIIQYFNSSFPSNLTVFPSQSNIHPFLQSSDLLLNLSIPDFIVETFGMTIIEGMAYGLPAIVPNVGGPIEIVENGYNGYTIDVSNLLLAADSIRDILKTENYSRMFNNALNKVKKFEY